MFPSLSCPQLESPKNRSGFVVYFGGKQRKHQLERVSDARKESSSIKDAQVTNKMNDLDSEFFEVSSPGLGIRVLGICLLNPSDHW